MQQYISANSEELSKQAADWLITLINDRLKESDRFTIALSGGSTPKKLFKLLALPEYARQIDWARLHFFWGDERFVSFSDDRNNAKMAYTELLQHVPIKGEQVHVMPTNIDPTAAALRYQQVLNAYFEEGKESFDLVLLGLGDNAHTLSLFPGYPAIIFEEKKWVVSFFLEEQDMYRITLTAPIVNSARNVAFLVSGEDKAIAVHQILQKDFDPIHYPAQVIKNANLFWFLDEPAAALIR